VGVETKSAKGAATRDQILDAASRIIHLRGYHCTSLDDVLRESNVGKGNFYYYFKSKEDLGYAIIDRVVKSFVDRILEPAFGDGTGNPLDQIAAFLDRVVDAQRERRGVGGCPMGNLACELSDVHEGFRQRLAGIFALWHARMTAVLQRGQAMGDLRADFDPVGAAQFLVAALEGALLMTKVTRDVSVLEKCADELNNHLLLYRAAVPPAADVRWPAGAGTRRAEA
jgi:TetR/AcrR family transcriptional regulator, transcriptional repressor for nem operon